MNEWKSLLKADPVPWLLEKENPSVRYVTLTDILDYPESDSEVIKTKEEIMTSGVVPKIMLSKSNPVKVDGTWKKHIMDASR
jgi:hypothetical protein